MIKKVGLGYLKRHYRYHPRAGDTESHIDVRGEGGIIVDAFYKLEQEDGTNFTAALEATSYDTREEVRYKLQNSLLTWDGVALSLFGTSGLFLFTLVFKLYLIKTYGTTAVIAGLCICFTLLFFCFRLFFSGMRRYRYIYAIEQFKRYFVNEQWIALAEDVFPDSENKFFKELKKQCVHNGIGLLVIDGNQKPTLFMTPSRDDLFDSKRRNVQFMSLSDFTANFPKGKYISWLGNIKIDLSQFLPKGKNHSLFRYQKSYLVQIAFSLLSLLAIGGVFYKQSLEKPIEYVDEAKHQMEHLPSQSRTEKEPLSYLVDSQFVVPYLNKVPQYTDLEMDTIDFLKVSVKKKKTTSKRKKPKNNNPEILISVGKEEEWLEYNCERFYTFTATKYIIEESRHAHLDMAAQRMEELERLGYEVSTIWMGCFFDSQTYYAVFLGPFLSNRNDAERELQYFNREMNQENRTSSLNIVAIPPKRKKR